jgi:multiple antibiotic resistance protein
LIAFAIVTVFAVTGSLLLEFFGITMDAFRIAGGLLITKVGYDLLHRGTSHAHVPSPAAQAEAAESDFSVVVSLLAMPLLAGPGTIVTAMTYTAHGSVTDDLVVAGAFAVVCAATMLCFLGAETLVSRVSPSLINVTGRLMGLILTVVGVQMVIEGIKAAFGA